MDSTGDIGKARSQLIIALNDEMDHKFHLLPLIVDVNDFERAHFRICFVRLKLLRILFDR